MMNTPQPNIWLTGGTTPPTVSQTLIAGPIAVRYENGFLRYLSWNGGEVLRMINFALRDHNWGTVPFVVEDEQIDAKEKSFRIQYRAIFDPGYANFHFDCTIEGHSNGLIDFTIDGLASSVFKTNRLGFTVLHPIIDYAGKSMTLIHSDGKTEESSFPSLISPHQPAFDLSALRWALPHQGEAEVAFEGDVFEMEDQRNWTDASYKTYCIPLARPFPVEIQPAQRIRQSIRFQLLRAPLKPWVAQSSKVSFDLGGSPMSYPKIGVAKSSQVNQLKSWQAQAIRDLELSHYRIDLDCCDPDWQAYWNTTTLEANSLALPIELAIHLPSEIGSAATLVSELTQTNPRLSSITLYQHGAKVTPDSLIQSFSDLLRQSFPEARIGCGTTAFFNELNRDRPRTDAIDFLSFSLNPQVHASDETSIVETLQAQPAVARTAQDFADGKAIHVSPISLKMQSNPNAIETDPMPSSHALPDKIDQRQMSFFNAVWTLGTIKQLAQSGVQSITFFETVGELGLMQSENSVHPNHFLAPPNSAYPVYFLLRELAGAESVLTLTSSDPLRVEALWTQRSGCDRLIVANLSAAKQHAEVPKSFRTVNKRTYQSESFTPKPDFQPPLEGVENQCLELPPYSFSVLESSTNLPTD